MAPQGPPLKASSISYATTKKRGQSPREKETRSPNTTRVSSTIADSLIVSIYQFSTVLCYLFEIIFHI